MALFFGGVPTRMDVEALLKIEIEAGVAVPYETIEEIIDAKWKSSRFRTVTNAWRRRLFRERLLQSTAEGRAFRFLTADQAHDQGKLGVSRIGRQAGRLRVRVEAVDANVLSDERRDRHQLLRREVQVLHEAAQRSAKAITAPPGPHTGASVRLAERA